MKQPNHQKKRKSTFRFRTFSPKQMKVMTWWRDGSPFADYDGIIADGAIRSGKTLSMSISFVMWACERFNGASFAICGKTVTSLRRNVITPLMGMLPALSCQFEEKHSESMMTIRLGQHVNDFYLFGGKDEGSQALIQGITLAGVFFDEVALMPESFVNQATARCSVEGAKWWFNCNPEGPFHWFKRQWIDRADERRLLYLHFVMTDNKTLSERTLEKYRNMYTGVFAQRFIEGKWAFADGVIYSMFSQEEHVADTADFVPERELIAVDYGTFNPCVFLHILAAGKGDGIAHFIDREYYHSGRDTAGSVGIPKDDGQYARDMLAFTGGRKDIPIIVDPSASSFITRLRHDGFTNVCPAKNAVSKGISAVSSEFSQRRLTISPACCHTLREIPSYVWDVRHAESCGQDRPLKENDHCCDAMRYGVYFDILTHASARPSFSGRGSR